MQKRRHGHLKSKSKIHMVRSLRAALAQLVRALDCGSRGPPFEPGRRYHSPSRGFPDNLTIFGSHGARLAVRTAKKRPTQAPLPWGEVGAKLRVKGDGLCRIHAISHPSPPPPLTPTLSHGRGGELVVLRGRGIAHLICAGETLRGAADPSRHLLLAGSSG